MATYLTADEYSKALTTRLDEFYEALTFRWREEACKALSKTVFDVPGAPEPLRWQPDQDDVEQAASTGALAVQMAGQVRSVRTTAYLSDVAMRLRRHEATPAVQQLFKRMTAAGIPLQRVQ